MKSLKYILTFCLVGVLASSCRESFLELKPLSNPTADNFRTKDDFELAVNAAYASLYTVYNPEGAVSYANEQMSDNAIVFNISGIQADKWQFKDYSLATANTMIYQFWQDFYKAIFNANIVLNKIEGASLDASYKDGVKAQMMFLRGLYYYNMVQLWGDVPLVTTPLTGEESYGVLRSPQAAVYDQIKKDLLFAADKLPLASAITIPGRASKGAAQTLLGKVYLTLGDKTAAASVLKEVYNSNQYSLLANYSDLWGPSVKNTKESVFEIQFLGGNASAPYSRYYQSFYPNNNFLGFYGGGMNQVTDDLWNEYETSDPRREVSIAPGYNNAGTFIAQKYPIKWTDTKATQVGGNPLSNNNFMVLRYADVLLMLTEATGDATYLNQVRTRAKLPKFGEAAYPSAKYATLDLAIEHERRVELAIEFQRWFDLKRTNRAVTVLSAKGKAINQNKLLWPVPQIVRTQNSAITQNTGY
ncbi:RagB/SusD family nutrient uptake outer membrane protein [Arsenicibacter rosenii]|uniref:RagB/SusD family nutrient uptake outer membrane protein n=1 Tax=Arsenicibacter rosenii TaxID=1750698 RepID=A0A1S2VBC5_9BACT|nr:RagB/SusD family nutrient uptake outer membrane protein [Arsenicibacter rosenii]OIN55516.1 RagB/SusD family nutrient uptake outer membrane protein [Arsenicibacter rosenii]